MGWWVTITVQLLIFGLKDSWCYRGDVAMQFYVISSRQPSQTGELVLVSLSYTIMKENTNQIAAGSKYQDCGRTVAGVKRWWTGPGWSHQLVATQPWSLLDRRRTDRGLCFVKLILVNLSKSNLRYVGQHHCYILHVRVLPPHTSHLTHHTSPCVNFYFSFHCLSLRKPVRWVLSHEYNIYINVFPDSHTINNE